MQKEIESLEAPVDLGEGIFNSVKATVLFKELVSGIQEGDLSYLEDRMEPSMFRKAQLKVKEAKKELDRQGLTMKVQSLRKSHETQFYLYNVQNYLLCGDISIDRANNKPEEDFIQEEN